MIVVVAVTRGPVTCGPGQHSDSITDRETGTESCLKSIVITQLLDRKIIERKNGKGRMRER